jgi:hypothetical protein
MLAKPDVFGKFIKYIQNIHMLRTAETSTISTNDKRIFRASFAGEKIFLFEIAVFAGIQKNRGRYVHVTGTDKHLIMDIDISSRDYEPSISGRKRGAPDEIQDAGFKRRKGDDEIS